MSRPCTVWWTIHSAVPRLDFPHPRVLLYVDGCLVCQSSIHFSFCSYFSVPGIDIIKSSLIELEYYFVFVCLYTIIALAYKPSTYKTKVFNISNL